MNYSDQLSLLSQSIFNFTEKPPDGLSDLVETESLSRIRIYQKNLFFGAYSILAEDYVNVQKHLEYDNFKFLVRKYLLENGIQSPNIFEFSKGFINFLKATEGFHQDPLLSLLAQLDWAVSHRE